MISIKHLACVTYSIILWFSMGTLFRTLLFYSHNTGAFVVGYKDNGSNQKRLTGRTSTVADGTSIDWSTAGVNDRTYAIGAYVTGGKYNITIAIAGKRISNIRFPITSDRVCV